jgi:hypothetical protein
MDSPVYEFYDGISLPEFDDIYRSILLFDPEDVLQRDAEEVTENDPVHSAVGDDSDVLSRMILQNHV